MDIVVNRAKPVVIPVKDVVITLTPDEAKHLYCIATTEYECIDIWSKKFVQLNGSSRVTYFGNLAFELKSGLRDV